MALEVESLRTVGHLSRWWPREHMRLDGSIDATVQQTQSKQRLSDTYYDIVS
jgi:hypothetical protein